MSTQNPIVLRLLDRMLETSQENVDTLVGSVQRVARELSSLSFNYNSHLIRAGMRTPELEALDGGLEAVSTSLNRTHFGLQQRLLGDVQVLRRLIAMTTTIDLADDRPLQQRLREGVDRYVEGLEREHHGISETLGTLTLQLRVLANNIEIAASHAGSDDVTAPVDLFCLMSGLLRDLADRLRNATGDLRIFEQTQNGHAESLRAALAIGEEGAAA